AARDQERDHRGPADVAPVGPPLPGDPEDLRHSRRAGRARAPAALADQRERRSVRPDRGALSSRRRRGQAHPEIAEKTNWTFSQGLARQEFEKTSSLFSQ